MAFSQKDVNGWVQLQGPGTDLEFLGDCINVDEIGGPRGGRTQTQCHTRDRKGYRVVNTKQEPPDMIEFTIEELIEQSLSPLEEAYENDCPVAFYFTLACGKAGIFNKWQKGWGLHAAYITDMPISQLAQRDSAEDLLATLNVSAETPRYNFRLPTVSRMDIAAVDALNDVAVCSQVAECGDCGPPKAAGDDVVAVGDAPAASPAAAGDVWYTGDASAWAAATESPFASGFNNQSVVCFEVDSNTSRWLVVRDADAANPLRVAYTDDSGATAWTEVVVGATGNEGATGPNSLFALDMHHIWLVTDQGNCYFSSDGGATWAEQDSASVAGGASALNAVHFLEDAKIGVAVGDTDTVITTVDGGDSWVAGTATGGGDNLDAVVVHNAYRVSIGTDITGGGDGYYMSFDFCTTYAARGDFTVDGVKDIQFANELQGYAINGAAANADVYMTIDGGRYWRVLATPDNAGLNAISIVNGNYAYVVGEVEGGTAVVLKVKG